MKWHPLEIISYKVKYAQIQLSSNFNLVFKPKKNKNRLSKVASEPFKWHFQKRPFLKIKAYLLSPLPSLSFRPRITAIKNHSFDFLQISLAQLTNGPPVAKCNNLQYISLQHRTFLWPSLPWNVLLVYCWWLSYFILCWCHWYYGLFSRTDSVLMILVLVFLHTFNKLSW